MDAMQQAQVSEPGSFRSQKTDLTGCDLIIEAVFENRASKRR